jgi:hypothetical protein
MRRTLRPLAALAMVAIVAVISAGCGGTAENLVSRLGPGATAPLLGNECLPNRCSCPSVRAVNRWNHRPVLEEVGAVHVVAIAQEDH